MSLIKEVLRHPPGLTGNEADTSITIRPHHVLLDSVRDALTRRRRAPVIAERCTSRLLNLMIISGDDLSGYYSDVLGVAYQGWQEFQRAAEDFFTRLQDLPDDSFAHLDLKPDGMCEACVIGRHCSGTNFITNFPSGSTVQSELNCLRQIRQTLELKGYVMGVDFTTQPTTHRLYDFGGRTLNTHPAGEPKIIAFNSMIVQVIALRDIS